MLAKAYTTATSAKPLAGAAAVPVGGAAPPKTWNSRVPQNSATSARTNSLRIWPLTFRYLRTVGLHRG